MCIRDRSPSSNISINFWGKRVGKKGGKLGKIWKRKQTEKNQAERTENSESPGRNLPIPKFWCRTDPYRSYFGHIKVSDFCVPKISLDIRAIFRFSVFWGFPGTGSAPGGFYGKFQYRTIRFCGVSWPPCPENLVRNIFCSKFGEFQGAVFPVQKIMVPKIMVP